ncbi:hypothetical protein CkaCkLH20_10064 [Colletotrichum karsti]|uniref:Uncharacterized protein n=1 Tax=Colletotrichum karsti TaxID=1095194 RepID=A0A9P6LHH3_9PEZI|nr:uncharacterized protein CkaCkLH20_10064 [Colletotrichum karsti]KAF9872567.1 hypothetical protein CkaCkLH20_10064 [Colletotrichum karsti]
MLCRIFLFTSALCLMQISTAQQLCYYPNGRQSPDVPCNISAPVSMCCGSAKACLSNGLCMLDDTTENSGVSYARGTCTDAQWTSGVCPRQCLLNQDSPNNSSAYDFRSSGVQVWECDAVLQHVRGGLQAPRGHGWERLESGVGGYVELDVDIGGFDECGWEYGYGAADGVAADVD